ncbi:rifin [Plasmodium reichenowi]|uniref:Rifin n=1 Tax=Plasmodium reichenowi TaxID=5854 RepID=A0A060RQ88_PLARE|nr:rifin [Plasmodium reichenowi]
MKMNYFKILLFALALNILLTSYYVYSKNKPSITSHHTTRYTSRVLSECDTQSSGYDKDEEMKSVKEQFDDRTSQRFEEYEERMKDKRQKHKEQRDKNIQEIIQKDKREKSLAEKIEKGCLKCGCGLGGVAASVGLFGGFGTYGWKSAATAAATELSKKAGFAAAKAEGDAAGIQKLISGLEGTFGLKQLNGLPLTDAVTAETYFNKALIVEGVKREYESCFQIGSTCEKSSQFGLYISMGREQGAGNVVKGAELFVEEAVNAANKVTTKVTESKIAEFEIAKLRDVAATSTYSYSAIGYSVLAILIIVLVMIIIYLVLRYRRKKKMKKKAQYTKLLNQ